MIDHRRLKFHSIGKFFKAAGSAVIAFVLFVMKVEPSALLPNFVALVPALSWVKQEEFFLLVAGFVLQCLGAYIGRHGQPVVLRAIQELLDSVHRKAFPGATGAPENFCRVTLFKRKRWSFRGAWDARSHFVNWNREGPIKWPWSGWIVPYMRSGQLKGKSTAAFYAPTDDCHLAEGMAGQAWTQADAKSVVGLKELSANANLKQLATYAKATYTPLYLVRKYVKSGRPLPRCMTAYQVCTNNGRPWGSIVIDSRDPEAVNEQAAYEAINTISSSLTALLEGVK